MDLEQTFREHKICAILRNIPTEDVLDYARAAFDGGIRLFEVALNSPDGYRQISMLRDAFGGQAAVGAGTALTASQILDARGAGAGFILTPSVSEEVLDCCRMHEIPLLPGVMTPSDVGLCVRYGFRTLKLFPAGDLPINYIQSLRGPFSDTQYVAVGGVGPENLMSFLDAGFLGAGIGSGLVPARLQKEKDWAAISKVIAQMMEEVTLPVTRDP